jgi:hypothetical protein
MYMQFVLHPSMAIYQFVEKKAHMGCSADRPASARDTLATVIGYEAVKRGMTVMFRPSSVMPADYLTGRAERQLCPEDGRDSHNTSDRILLLGSTLVSEI